MVLREARPPYKHRRPLSAVLAIGLALGTGLGAIILFGWIFIGTVLIASAGILGHLSR
jgi:hypothetical protein